MTRDSVTTYRLKLKELSKLISHTTCVSFIFPVCWLVMNVGKNLLHLCLRNKHHILQEKTNIIFYKRRQIPYSTREDKHHILQEKTNTIFYKRRQIPYSTREDKYHILQEKTNIIFYKRRQTSYSTREDKT